MCSTCVNYSAQVEYIRLALIYFTVCHAQVECIRPALFILRRSSVFDLRYLFFAGRVCSTCAHLFHRLPRAGRVYSTCVIYSSQVECVGPAHYFLFYFTCLSLYTSYLTFFLYFTITSSCSYPNSYIQNILTHFHNLITFDLRGFSRIFLTGT